MTMESPMFLNVYLQLKKKIAELPDHEYAPIIGALPIRQVSAELIFGKDSSVIREGRNVTVQAISGTGALRVAGEFLSRFLPNTPIYLPKPTWANHIPIFKDSGLEVREYTYYNPQTCGLKYEELLNDVKNAPEGSIFLYHACAHNPTGVDPTPEQWKEISRVTKERKHFALFDCAYQGFASGDCEKDVFAVRQFIEDGHNIAVCQSFAKNFGLYGERVGAFTVVAASKEEAARVESQLKILLRPMYSNPPIYGAKVVSAILSDAELKALWLGEVKLMSGRIINMRDLLVKNLQSAGSQRNWSHIISQIGMFCFTGITPEQCDRLKNDYHIYLTRNGRISVAGITSKNVEYLAKSVHEVTK